MREKQSLKHSEARVLIYLSIVEHRWKNVTAISNKLEIDYSYLLKILSSMTAKGWLRKEEYRRYMYYHLTKEAPLESALNTFSSDALQKDLRDNYTTPEVLPQPEVSEGDSDVQV